MADPSPDTGDDTGTPRWVKVQAIFVVLLVVVVIGMAAGLTPGFIGGEGGEGLGHAPPEGGH